MKLVKSVLAHSYRRGKPFGRHSFYNGAKGMANLVPDKPVVLHGSGAPGLAVFFGFTGYVIWQSVECRRIIKAADKGCKYHREASLRSTRICEGYDEISRLIAKKTSEEEEEEEEEGMERPWWCGSA